MSEFSGEQRSNARRDYVSYLAMLQEKNRLLKRMRRKDTGQLQLERREQGFALYLNGANLPPHKKKEPRATKTAGNASPTEVSEEIGEERAKTAPSKRKSWSHKSLLLKAEEGTPVQIAAPDILTGSYEEDFEESDLTEEGGPSSDDELALSLADVSRLRASLEGDASLHTYTGEGEHSPDSLSEGSTLSVCSEELDNTSTATRSLISPLELATDDEETSRSHTVCEPESSTLRGSSVGQPSEEEEDTLSVITKKVKALSIKKQRDLLQLLQGLEADPAPSPTPSLAPPQSSVVTLHPSRPASGRTSGLRGEMMLGKKPNPLLVSQSDPHLPTFLDDHDDVEPERSRTATLGRRRHLLNPSSSEMVLLPCISPHDDSPPHEDTTAIMDSSLQTEGDFDAPKLSSSEPLSRREERQDINGCLASITEFDHAHLGQIDSTNDADTILEDFLREHRHQTEDSAPNPPTADPPERFPTTPEDFPLPVLPSGRTLVLRVSSTWGDRHYVGLTGIEIFTAPLGRPASIAAISADPADINVLPEYGRDPRVVGNLLDGVNRTQDDLHMWLAPFQPGQTVTICFSHFTSIALVRIWNYSKSRIHSSRGVRGLDMLLDGALIFRGEVCRGASETVLFTTSEELLLKVSRHDETFQREASTAHASDEEPEEPVRPATASGQPLDSVRPLTCAASSQPEGRGGGVHASEVQLVLAESWGDPSSLGLTGLQLQPAVPTQPVRATCSDCGDIQTLFDGENLTIDPAHMWLASSPPPHTLTLSLATPSLIEGIKVWNYNSSPEDSYSGVKLIHVLVEGVRVSPESGFLLRKAPGLLHYDFGQLISFTEPPAYPSPAPGLPTGFVFQLQLLSTWGDPYYIGLNGVELLDELRRPIPLTAENMAAYPASVNVLPGVAGDVRTPDKLVDGHYDTDQGCHMWLAPLLPHTHNSVFVLFDSPRCVSGLRLWNYSKTASRGVREFAVLVDDLLVLQASLPATHIGGILPTVRAPLVPSTFWLSTSEHGEGGPAVCCGGGEVKQKPSAVNQRLRPSTSVTLCNI